MACAPGSARRPTGAANDSQRGRKGCASSGPGHGGPAGRATSASFRALRWTVPQLDVVIGAAAFCCLGFAVASLIGNVDAAQPVMWVTVLPLSFISGIFISMSELPSWLADIGYVFPLHPLAAALLTAYNPHTTGSGLNWDYLAILAAWAPPD